MTMRPPMPTQLHDSCAALGLPMWRAAASGAAPKYRETEALAPKRIIGFDANASLKASFWQATIDEAEQLGDFDFVSTALNLGGGRVWRNDEPVPTGVGAVALHPFEGARWRFEQPVSFVKLYVPFKLVSGVCESLFDRALSCTELRMPTGLRDDSLCRAASTIQARLRSIEPTNLILDSWALILSENLLRSLSSHAHRQTYPSFGKIPGRGMARVVDYIEASLDRDLRLASLAAVAGMSVYHFARRFKETVGMSPHAYVLARRLKRAEELLKGKARLVQVAVACGFASQSHFTTAFQKNFGVTPDRYRRSLQ
jgi:AraC family transcriptional regulator